MHIINSLGKLTFPIMLFSLTEGSSLLLVNASRDGTKKSEVWDELCVLAEPLWHWNKKGNTLFKRQQPECLQKTIADSQILTVGNPPKRGTTPKLCPPMCCSLLSINLSVYTHTPNTMTHFIGTDEIPKQNSPHSQKLAGVRMSQCKDQMDT